MNEVEDIAARIAAAGHTVTFDYRIRETAAAKLVGVTPRTMRNWRALGIGPSYIAAGVLTYRIQAVLEFLVSRENKVTPL